MGVVAARSRDIANVMHDSHPTKDQSRHSYYRNLGQVLHVVRVKRPQRVNEARQKGSRPFHVFSLNCQLCSDSEDKHAEKRCASISTSGDKQE